MISEARVNVEDNREWIILSPGEDESEEDHVDPPASYPNALTHSNRQSSLSHPIISP